MENQIRQAARGHSSSWWDTHTGALKSAAGVAFLFAALYQATSAWVGVAERPWLAWVLPIAGAVLGYLFAEKVKPTSE